MTRSSSKIVGELRPSQIITTFGPGSVIDQPSLSLVLAGLDFWNPTPDQLVDEPRLRAMMGVRNLYRPAVKSDGSNRNVPAFVFPRFLVCPRCQRLATFEHFRFERGSFKCRNAAGHAGLSLRSEPRAFPARFVTACAAGHLDDFPWSYYAHRGNVTACDPLALKFFELSQSGSISDLYVHCEACDARPRSMDAAFGEGATRALGACQGGRPWLQDHEHGCAETPRAVLRGASNLYFPIIQSALSIPDWDDPLQAAIGRQERNLDQVQSIEDLRIGLRIGAWADLRGHDADAIWSALQERRGLETNAPTPTEVRREEYRALRQPTEPVLDGREFRTTHSEIPASWAEYLRDLVIVSRLREVRAISSFTRIDSPPDLLLEDDEAAQQVKRQSLGARDWCPAVELLGEGIFFTLHEDKVRAWEDRAEVRARRADMERSYAAWRAARDLPDAPFPGSRFVLLHSLGHMLITALSLDCGYSSASIRERVYSSSDADAPMAGVLLYTATPDSDGSLGGLADQGRTDRFGHLLETSLRRATYCSSDPLCGHSAAGELGQTNGAACHACLLVPETCCERSNRFLDRAHVVQTVAQLGTEYFV